MSIECVSDANENENHGCLETRCVRRSLPFHRQLATPSPIMMMAETENTVSNRVAFKLRALADICQSPAIEFA